MKEKNKQNWTYVFVMLLVLGMIGSVSAYSIVESKTNVVKQGQPYVFNQFCANSTYSNISTIKLSSQVILNQTAMVEISDDNYRYTFSNTSTLGTYTIVSYCDENGEKVGALNDFEVTPSGFINTFGFYLIILFFLSGLIILGYSTQEAWFIMFAGFGFMMIGLYSIINGVVGFKDMFMTWGLGLFELGLGFYFTIRAGLHKIQESEIDVF